MIKFECFSKRNGLVDIDDAIQINGMNDALRNAIWSYFWDGYVLEYRNFWKFMFTYWLKKPLNEIPEQGYFYKQKFYKYYEDFSWNQIYDLLECTYLYYKEDDNEYELERYTNSINDILERENSGYRLIDGHIVPISNEIEIQSVNESLNSSPFNEIKRHFEAALFALSDREHPNYRNSIKESISAVEVFCRRITKESTLGKALPKLESEGIKIPTTLKQSISKMYDFTNGKEGIRHALMDETAEPGLEEAKYMLITCSAFVNYLTAKWTKIRSADGKLSD